jgi:DNA-binding transcriptional LysR family regulator
MDILDLEYLTAAAVAGNFGRAAEALGVNVSTVSRRIGRVEDELGLALFERVHSGVRLTAGGDAVMLHVRRALAEVEAAKLSGMRVGSGRVGEVRLGIQLPPVGEVLVSLLATWHETHPGVKLTVAEMSDVNLADAVEARKLDVAVTPRHALWKQAAYAPLYRDALQAALPEGHFCCGQPSVSPNDLQRENIMIQDWEDSQAGRDFYAFVLGAETNIRAHAASKPSIFALVRAGFGIALATSAQATKPVPGVIFKPIDNLGASVEMVLAWNAGLEDPVVGRFVACLRDAACSRRLC